MPDKVHRYAVQCSWRGNTGLGYEAYGREHEVVAVPTAERLHLSADPAFRGDPKRLNPELLLVMAAASCQLLSFLAIAARARITVLSYDDAGEAEMPEDDPPMRITIIRLRPRIFVAPGTNHERVKHLVDLAHQECYIANSLKTNVTIEPSIEDAG